jgi:hypothetical protein
MQLREVNCPIINLGAVDIMPPRLLNNCRGRSTVTRQLSLNQLTYLLSYVKENKSQTFKPLPHWYFFNTQLNAHTKYESKFTDFHSFIHQWLYSPSLGPGLFFIFLIFFTQTELLGWVISSSQGRYPHTGQRRHRHSWPWVGFEPTIPAFERTKTVHALDRAAIMIGLRTSTILFSTCL